MYCGKICGAAESTVLSDFDQWHVNKLDSAVASLAKLREDSSPNSRIPSSQGKATDSTTKRLHKNLPSGLTPKNILGEKSVPKSQEKKTLFELNSNWLQ